MNDQDIKRYNIVPMKNTVAQDHGVITAQIKVVECSNGAWIKYDDVSDALEAAQAKLYRKDERIKAWKKSSDEFEAELEVAQTERDLYHKQCKGIAAQRDEFRRSFIEQGCATAKLQAELEQVQAEIERLRDLHKRNLHDARPYRADPSHRCDWRMRAEAMAERSRKALAATGKDDD